ncbi:MAG TPA: DnaA/Hda family protein [Pirellulaceae bacterium]|nr:DnaA/Hda family protein [Pirellulaceae bacterium]HMO91717.1 DnaA/Hda family protein [Pirellulaceae bacterium]HMP69820.1 DnaA/Hda family protein [Pirellulaceae bacterium]
MIERLGDDRFDLWFEGVESFEFDGSTLTVRSPDLFTQNRVKQVFFNDLRFTVDQLIGAGVEINFGLFSAEPSLSPGKNGDVDASQVIDGETLSESRGGAEMAATFARSTLDFEPSLGSELSQPINHRKVPTHKFSGNREAKSVDTDFTPSTVSIKTPVVGETDGASTKTLEHSRDSWALGAFHFGSNNALARSAVQEILHGSHCAFSPMYLFGPVGCGKTHLLRGMISAFRQKKPMLRCIYLTAEQFTANFVQALDGRGVSDFRRKCRGLDVLAVDDIQFLAGKRATLIEFHSTLEALIRNGKKILLAGDRSLMEMRSFEPELVNRIAGGLPCPIHYVDTDARKEILRDLARSRDIPLSHDLTEFLAKFLIKDVRHLSGALNRIQAARFAGIHIEREDQVRELVADLFCAAASTISIRDVEATVQELSGVSVSDLRSDSRCRSASDARALAMFLSRHLTGSAYSEIGHHFGGRSHSTVISAHQKVIDWLKRNHYVTFNNVRCNVNDVVRRIEAKLRTG